MSGRVVKKEMRIWFDILTPKQVLFFEPLIRELRKDSPVLVTYRKHRETSQLIKNRNIKSTTVGFYNGGTRLNKLLSGIDRIERLVPLVRKFKPDLAVSSSSPDCAYLSFKLGIRHYTHSNSPNAEKSMRLSIPLSDKLFIPWYLSKSLFTKYGISERNIIKYDGFDEHVIIQNSLPVTKFEFDNFILIRSVEQYASYRLRKFNFPELVTDIANAFDNTHVIVLPRYDNEIIYLKDKFQDISNITVYDRVFDSRQMLESCSVFVGSGGTMTTESALRGISTLSINAAPNQTEKYLIRKGLLSRAESTKHIINSISRLIDNPPRIKLPPISNPHDVILKTIRRLNN